MSYSCLHILLWSPVPAVSSELALATHTHLRRLAPAVAHTPLWVSRHSSVLTSDPLHPQLQNQARITLLEEGGLSLCHICTGRPGIVLLHQSFLLVQTGSQQCRSPWRPGPGALSPCQKLWTCLRIARQRKKGPLPAWCCEGQTPLKIWGYLGNQVLLGGVQFSGRSQVRDDALSVKHTSIQKPGMQNPDGNRALCVL